MNTNKNMHRRGFRARQRIARVFARTRVGLGVFTYLLLGMSPALADDIDIYTKAVASGGGGGSVIMFHIDTSASMLYEFETKEANNKQDGMPSFDADAYANSLLDQRFFLLSDAMRGQVTSLGGNYKVGIVGQDGAAGGVVYAEAKPLSSGLLPAAGAGAGPTGGVQTFPITQALDDVEQATSAAAIDSGQWYLDLGMSSGGGWGRLNTLPFTAHWTSSAGSVAGTGLNDWPPSYNYYWPGGGAGNIAFDYYHESTSGTQTIYLSSATTDTVLYVIGWDANWTTYGNILTGAYPSPGDNTGAPQKVCVDDAMDWEYNATKDYCQTKCVKTSPKPPCAGKIETKTKAYVLQSNTNSFVTLSGLVQGRTYLVIAATKTAGVSADFQLNLEYPDRGHLEGYLSTWSGTSNEQRVGLRFRNLGIPAGATINDARLQLQSSDPWNTQVTARMRVGIDTATSPADFLVTDLWNRTFDWEDYQDIESWEHPWVDGESWWLRYERTEDQRFDVKDLLQDQIDRTGWCGGDVVLAIEGDHTAWSWQKRREIWSYEAASYYKQWNYPLYAPTLTVDWSPGATSGDLCGTPMVKTYKISSSSEDVSQQADGSVQLDAEYLSVSNNQKTGLRFSLVDIPKDAVVENVKLVLTAHASGSPSAMTIRGINEGLAKPFGAAVNELNDRELMPTTVNYTPGSWVAGNTYTIDTPELKTLVQNMVKGAGWEFDGTLGFILAAAGGEMQVRSWERTASGADSLSRGDFGTMAPKLIVTLRAGTAMPTGKSHRRSLVEWLDGFVPFGYTSIAGSYLQMANYVKGRTPLPQPSMLAGACSNNVAILVTDVFENANSYSGFDAQVATVTGKASCGGNASEAWPCLFSMLDAMYEPEKAGAAGLSADGQYYAMRTYSIGMGPLAQTGGGQLRASANHGGGEFFPAKNSAELIQYFRDIIKSVADTGATIAAPGVSVNALNKFEHLDELYYSLFKPSVQADWEGNIKRYRLKSGVITDVNGAPAINNTDTSLFAETARSWWSPDIDGATVTVGGASGKLTAPDSRRIYTWRGVYGPSLNADLVDGAPEDGQGSEALTPLNPNLTPDLLGVPETLSGASQWTRKEQAVAYLRGGTNTVARRVFGAAIHASPTLVTFGIDSGGVPENTVFIGDNNGVLHMIDTGAPSSDDATTNIANTGGGELFAFLPQELLKNGDPLNAQKPSVLAGDYIYGLDGTWVPWKYDVGGDGIDAAAGDRVYLYGGMRRGGRNVLALDVTSVRRTNTAEQIKPKLQWVIEGGKIGTPFEYMGQTWSEPAPRWVHWGGERKRVVFFAGGYDAAVHDGNQAFNSAPQLGRQMYMVDALSGELLWWASSDAAADTEVPDMKYSMTATPVTMDRNGNGVTDGLYIVDLAGQVFRFDFNEAATSAADFVKNDAAVLVASLGATAAGANATSDNRRFYDMPAVAFVRSAEGGDLMIGVVSGYREEPTNKDTQEIAIMFRDIGAWNISPPARATITLADLIDVTAVTELSGTQLAAPGWYLPLDITKGEKGIGSPVFFNFALLFTTFVPEGSTAASACTPDVGYSRLYALNALTAGGIVDEKLDNVPDNQRYLDEAMPGLGSTIQLLYMGGELTLVSGTLAMTAEEFERDDSNLLDAGNIGDLKRTRWYRVEE